MGHQKILVIGASGYVGSRLVLRLLRMGYCVKAAGRSIERLKDRPWANDPNVELCAVDVQDLLSLERACQDCQVVYFLMHSMGQEDKDFAESDREAAFSMAKAAKAAHVQQIIYLGGLGESEDRLSRHLRSRKEVGEILASGTVPVTILRAAMVIGTGSASFEILRHLVNRLPVMITPRWLYIKSQPIAIGNVLDYLTGCLGIPEVKNTMLDIGGPDILTYADLIELYTKQAHLRKRLILPVPLLTPNLSAHWIALVTPVPLELAQPLSDGLRNTMICKDHRITHMIPLKLISCADAIAQALREKPMAGDPKWVGNPK